MATLTLTTDAMVLMRRPSTSDSFQSLSVFSPLHGSLFVLQRVVKKSGGGKGTPVSSLDLFSEVSLLLESSNQGSTWFVKESRVVRSSDAIGKRGYEALLHASAFAALVARNSIPEETREKVFALLRQSMAAFATAPRPDIAYVKSLFCFVRDEGYAVKQQWFPSLTEKDRESVLGMLNNPLTEQTASPDIVVRIRDRLEAYVRSETEILIE